MTAAEVVSLAFTRNMSELHFKTADITQAQDMYVDEYVAEYDESSTFFTTYCKPVIAYGCAINCFERIASEITDRGVVDMISNGASRIDPINKAALKSELRRTLTRHIKLMMDAAELAGLTVIDISYDLIQGSTQTTYNEL